MSKRVGRACRIVTAVFLLGLPGPVTAQVRDGAGVKALRGSAVITGVVVSADDTAKPLRRTLLTLASPVLGTDLLALSDEAGRFEFRNLPEGRFTLAARKSGYVRDAYGARPAGVGAGVPIAVKDKGQIAVTMRLVRSAAIGGRVIMPPGAPVSSVRLRVLRWRRVSGRRLLVAAQGGASGVSGTGEYRIGGLPPGEYVLAAYTFGGGAVGRIQGADGPGTIVGMAPVYSPGTTDPMRAQAIALSAGDDRRGVDLVMDFVEMARISGRVVGPDGQPVPFVQVSSAVTSPVNPFVAPVRTKADGTFVMPAVVPGPTTIVARGAIPGTEQTRAPLSRGPLLPWWASETVQLSPGAAQDGLELRLRPGRTIRGRIVADDALEVEQPPEVPGVMLRLGAEESDTNVVGLTATESAADGTFELVGVAPGRYRLEVTLPGPLESVWVVSSVADDDGDVLDTPIVVGADEDVSLVVGLSDDPSVLTGTVADTQGQAAPEQSVIVFSTIRKHWTQPSRRVAHIRTGPDGTYEIRGLPDGTYHAAVVPDLESDDLLTEEFLESLTTSSRVVTVKNRTRTVQELMVLRR